MTPEEEAYEEALRRIREAEKTGALELDLSGWKDGGYTGLETLTRLPPELGRLTSLQSLNLRACVQLSDLFSLAGLTSLQTLNLTSCKHDPGSTCPKNGPIDHDATKRASRKVNTSLRPKMSWLWRSLSRLAARSALWLGWG
jgi:hypothetical protein